MTFDLTLAIGRKRAFAQPIGFGERLLDRLLDRPVGSKLRRRFGGRLKAMISAGAPLSPEIGGFFLALGVPLLQGYGHTEAAPGISCNSPAWVKIDTVGQPLEGRTSEPISLAERARPPFFDRERALYTRQRPDDPDLQDKAPRYPRRVLRGPRRAI